MKAVFKWTYKISSEYADIKTWLDKTPDVSCFKPGNPDYDKCWGEQSRHLWADPFQNEYVTKYVNRLNEHFANGDISSEIFPEDRFEIDEENDKWIIYVRWENKTALEEYVEYKMITLDPEQCDIYPYEIIDLS